jgi:O-antigen/teichoic acid export membrane protein
MKKIGIINSAGIYVITSLATSAIPFLLLPILTRILTPADYGIVAMFGIWVSILGVFVGLSVQGAIGVRYFEYSRTNMQQYVSSCIYILLLTTVLTLICVLLFKPVLEKYSSLPSQWLILGVIVAGMQFVVSVRLSLWQVAKHPLKYGTLQIIQSAINVGLSLWLVVAMGFAWEGRLIGISVTALIVMLGSLRSLWRESWLTPNINLSYVRDALKFGVPLMPHVLGGMLLTAIDRIMVANILGIDHAGVYTVALQIGMVLSLFTVAVNQAYAPWLFEQLRDLTEYRKCQIVRYTYLYFIALIIVALLVGLYANIIILIIAGDQFKDGAEVVIYITMGFAFGGMYFMVTNYVFYASATGKLAINTLVAGLVNVILTYVLIQKNGITGAAQGFMISQAFLFLGTWRLAHYAHPMPWLKCFLKDVNDRSD